VAVGGRDCALRKDCSGTTRKIRPKEFRQVSFRDMTEIRTRERTTMAQVTLSDNFRGMLKRAGIKETQQFPDVREDQVSPGSR
jgi:hypothetical protein